MTAETRCDHLIQTWPVRPPTGPRASKFLAAIVMVIAAFFVSWAPAGATGQALTRPGDVRSGTLLLKGDNDGHADAIRLGIDVDLTVSGPTIRARVTNPARIAVDRDHASSVARSSSSSCSTCVVNGMPQHPAPTPNCQGTNAARH